MDTATNRLETSNFLIASPAHSEGLQRPTTLADACEQLETMVPHRIAQAWLRYGHWRRYGRRAHRSITGYIRRAKTGSDAEVIAGGRYSDEDGFFIRPTIVHAKRPDHETMCDEIFGPVMSIHVYPDNSWSDTLDIVDSTSPYALTGAVFLARPLGRARGDGPAASRRGQLLHQRQAHGRGGRPAAFRRRQGIRHQRQGRVRGQHREVAVAAEHQGEPGASGIFGGSWATMRWLSRSIQDRIETLAVANGRIEQARETLAELEADTWGIALQEIEGERYVVLPFGTLADPGWEVRDQPAVKGLDSRRSLPSSSLDLAAQLRTASRNFRSYSMVRSDTGLPLGPTLPDRRARDAPRSGHP